MNKSTFFLILVFLFLSCGIPNYFYLGSNYISYSVVTMPNLENNSSAYKVTVRITDPVQLAKCRNCPSIALFYFLDTSSFSSEKSTFRSKFTTTYNSYSINGIALDVKEGSFESVIEKYTPVNDTNIKLGLYPFMFADLNEHISRPGYHITFPISTGSEPDDTLEFLLLFSKKDNKVIIRYTDKETQVEKELVRQNYLPFSDLPSYDLESYIQDHEDYGAVTDRLDIKLNIMCAMSVSEGNFDNFFWSDLKEIGSFELNLQETTEGET